MWSRATPDMIRRLLLVCGLLVLGPVHVAGQQLSGPVDQMRSLLGRQLKGDEDMERLGQAIVVLAWELLKASTESAADRRALEQVTFLYERAEGLTAARIQGGQIVISTGPLFELMTGAALL